MTTERIRVQFDFSEDALQRLDALKERSQAKNRAEVVRSALRLYEWFLEEFQNEKAITVRKESNGKELHMPMSLLM